MTAPGRIRASSNLKLRSSLTDVGRSRLAFYALQLLAVMCSSSDLLPLPVNAAISYLPNFRHVSVGAELSNFTVIQPLLNVIKYGLYCVLLGIRPTG